MSSKLSDLTPACVQFTGDWTGDKQLHRSSDVDVIVNGSFLPVPGDQEIVLSRWAADVASLTAVAGTDTLHAQGEFALLLTDQTLRGSVVLGGFTLTGLDGGSPIWAGQNCFRQGHGSTISFVWPLATIEAVGMSSAIGKESLAHLRTGRASLAIYECAKAKENFLAKGIGYLNRSALFAEDLAQAVSVSTDSSVTWREAGDITARDRIATFTRIDRR